MKRLTLAIAATVLALVPMAATAQKKAPANVEIPPNVFVMAQPADQYLARDLLLGAKVRGPDGKIIGDVEDFILNADNQIVGVIMGVGGFLGAGEKRIGVRYSALKIATDNDRTVVTLPEATKDVLKALPPFKRSRPAKSFLDSAIEKANELADKTAVTSSDAYQKAKEQAGPMLEKAKDAAQEAYEKAKDVAKEAYDKAKDAAQPKQ